MISAKLLAIGLVVCLAAASAIAQSAKKTMTGEYYLSGVREVGSGFKLNADSTFEFFFSYGALDRTGKGTWRQQGNQLILNSRPRPARDFALVTSRTAPGNQLTIKIVDPNTQLLRYVACEVKSDTTAQREMTNETGEALFSKPIADILSLRFEFVPERSSVFQVANKAHNYFEFRFEPWLFDVFFENATYTIDGTDLKGPHPLLEPSKTYSFERE